MDDDPDDAPLTNTQAAELLNIEPQSLAMMRMQGKGPEYRRNGRRIEYTARAIREFQQSRQRRKRHLTDAQQPR
jgi:hypothetical protein